MIKLIDYQITSIEASYLALKKNCLTEELQLMNNEKTTYEDLIELKKRHLNLIFDWVNELEDTDSHLLKLYYFDGMILENIASLLSISHSAASKKHYSIMKILNNVPLLNRFPYKETPLYSDYLKYKDELNVTKQTDMRRKYQREYVRLDKRTKK